MKKEYEALVERWRESAKERLVENPEDNIALGLQKCANDLERALKSNACERTIGALIAAAMLLFEVTPERVTERDDRVSYTLVEHSQRPFQSSLSISTEHTHQEPTEPASFTVRVASASGTNVAAQSVSGSFVLPPRT